MPLIILLQPRRIHFHGTSAPANGYPHFKTASTVEGELLATYVGRDAKSLVLTELNTQLAKYLTGPIQYHMMPAAGRCHFYDIIVQ